MSITVFRTFIPFGEMYTSAGKSNACDLYCFKYNAGVYIPHDDCKEWVTFIFVTEIQHSQLCGFFSQFVHISYLQTEMSLFNTLKVIHRNITTGPWLFWPRNTSLRSFAMIYKQSAHTLNHYQESYSQLNKQGTQLLSHYYKIVTIRWLWNI